MKKKSITASQIYFQNLSACFVFIMVLFPFFPKHRDEISTGENLS